MCGKTHIYSITIMHGDLGCIQIVVLHEKVKQAALVVLCNTETMKYNLKFRGLKLIRSKNTAQWFVMLTLKILQIWKVTLVTNVSSSVVTVSR